MTAYYNDNDPFVVRWMNGLVKAQQIAPGDVDDRSIADIQAGELATYDQCHFFAGIGGWSLALRRAGVPDSAPIWTGSCPCQPFSSAGKGLGTSDPRHLWPAWSALIEKCRPPIIFGEQVASEDGLGWLDDVFADLERCGYTVGAADICAASVGAPHNRSRLYFVAHTDQARRTIVGAPWLHGLRPPRNDDAGCGQDSGVADADGIRSEEHPKRGAGSPRSVTPRDDSPSIVGHAEVVGRATRRVGRTRGRKALEPRRPGDDGAVGDAGSDRDQQHARQLHRDEGEHEKRIPLRDHAPISPGAVRGFWSDAEWVLCNDPDGPKWRPVRPGTFPLATGVPGRVGLLRGYGNSINVEVAVEFICASLEAIAQGA